MTPPRPDACICSTPLSPGPPKPTCAVPPDPAGRLSKPERLLLHGACDKRPPTFLAAHPVPSGASRLSQCQVTLLAQLLSACSLHT